MLNSFRFLSFIEGVSLLFLLFVAMPGKYYFGYFDVVFPAGMSHGVLWLTYATMSLIVSHKQNWSILYWLMVFFTSVIPFACFLLDARLKNEIASNDQVSLQSEFT